jgi:hypothetical protein
MADANRTQATTSRQFDRLRKGFLLYAAEFYTRQSEHFPYDAEEKNHPAPPMEFLIPLYELSGTPCSPASSAACAAWRSVALY